MKIETRQGATARVKLPGGDWSLDFANAWWEWETSYTHLLEWSLRVGLVDEQKGGIMTQRAELSPDEAQNVLERAISLRMLIQSIFSALAHGQRVDDGDLVRLNALLPHVLSKQRIIRDGDTFIWDWDEQDEGLDRMLWPAIRAAAELLMAPDLQWLKACQGEDCDRLFLDLSRNHSRRWCEMQHCGMLVKSRRHYAKKRLSRAKPA